MKKESLKLYFIAIVPDEPVFDEVMVMKTEVSQRFESKAALRSPPHITLHMPFQWKEEKEGRLISSLDAMASLQQGFEVQLKGFGGFPPRVIYINVLENKLLSTIQKVIQNLARSKWHIYPKSNSIRPFMPHMTIAFRDLKKPQFHEAWSTFKERGFNATISVTNICLLKHNGKSWDVLHRASLN